MYVGYVFICDADAVKDCMKRRLFTCSGENVQVVGKMETGSVVFLLNLASNMLVGPFTAAGSTGLKPGSWRETTDTRTNAGIRVEWEDLHELNDVQNKFPFLKDLNVCKLTHFQTQDLLNALEEAPRFSVEQGSSAKQD